MLSKFTSLIALAALFLIPAMRAQTPSPAAPSKDAAKSITLTDDEKIRVDNLNLQRALLNEQIQRVQRELQERSAAIDKTRADLETKLLAAHNLKATDYRLDEQTESLVPIPKPAAPVAPPAANK